MRVTDTQKLALMMGAGLGLAAWYLAGRAKAAVAAPFDAAAGVLSGAWESTKEGAATFYEGGKEAAALVPSLTPGGFFGDTLPAIVKKEWAWLSDKLTPATPSPAPSLFDLEGWHL